MNHRFTCEACGNPFYARQSNARTCSDSCRVTRWRREQRAELLRLRAALSE